MRDRITLTPEQSEMTRLQDWLKERADAAGLAESVLADLRLCLHEAVMNVICHAFPAGEPGKLEVEIALGNDWARALVSDNGVAFDPLTGPLQDKITSLETARVGGFGLRLMRETATALSYERKDGWNHLTMEFRPPANRDTAAPGT